jgi:hypothetical protein
MTTRGVKRLYPENERKDFSTVIRQMVPYAETDREDIPGTKILIGEGEVNSSRNVLRKIG